MRCGCGGKRRSADCSLTLLWTASRIRGPGHETCAYADVHRSVYKTDTSAVYIPLKFNMLRETSVTMVVLSMGVDNYTQEHLDICSCLQPVFIDNFLNILSENSSDRAFDLPSPKSKQEPNSKRNKDNAEPFQTFNEVTINYIIKALNRGNTLPVMVEKKIPYNKP